MTETNYQILFKTLSQKRLEAYRTNKCRTSADVLSRYLWNLALSEAFYPVLNTLEVGLRNTTDSALARKFGADWLERDTIGLDNLQLDKLEAAQKELLKDGKPLEHGRLVAELPFGFWTAMYNVNREELCRGILQHAFPSLVGPGRTRAKVAARLDVVRKFRNRVFHHERIIHLNFMQVHGFLTETVGWMCPELSKLALATDRVKALYAAGPSAYDSVIASTFLAYPKPEIVVVANINVIAAADGSDAGKG